MKNMTEIIIIIAANVALIAIAIKMVAMINSYHKQREADAKIKALINKHLKK